MNRDEKDTTVKDPPRPDAADVASAWLDGVRSAATNEIWIALLCSGPSHVDNLIHQVRSLKARISVEQSAALPQNQLKPSVLKTVQERPEIAELIKTQAKAAFQRALDETFAEVDTDDVQPIDQSDDLERWK